MKYTKTIELLTNRLKEVGGELFALDMLEYYKKNGDEATKEKIKSQTFLMDLLKLGDEVIEAKSSEFVELCNVMTELNKLSQPPKESEVK